MLSISAMSGGQAGYYLGLAREDYYLEGGEPPGLWFGEGASALRLRGRIEADHLYNLFDGLSPNGARSLIQSQRHEDKADHRPGWDLTFSAPKTVSVLWSQASDGLRRRIQEAHAQAVESALAYLEETAGLTRRGKGDHRLEGAGLVVARFEHSTSRALDPQLHTHALVMNLCVRDDGTTGAVSSLSLFQAKMAAGALYRADLAARLEREAGLGVERHRSWFEVSGVPDALSEAFSKRREAIEAELDRTGATSAKAAARAAIETREAKEAVSRSEMFLSWRGEGAAHGWSTREADALFDRPRPERDLTEEFQSAASAAILRITEGQAHFTRREFVRHVAEEAQGRGLGAGEALASCEAHLADSPEIVRLGTRFGEERFTTREMYALESRLLSHSDRMAADRAHRVDPESVVGLLSRSGELSEEQMKAVFHVTCGSGGIAVVSGMAGTGKTRLLDVARQAWEEEGLEVRGAALAARAGKELENGSRIPSATIAKILHDAAKGDLRLGTRTVLVVDEAGMVATPEMERLARLCADAGAKLVLVGDERQLQPIGPGAPFAELGARHGQAELRDIRRQSEPWARDAVRSFADGDAARGLAEFAERGLLRVAETREEAIRALVRQWKEDAVPLGDSLIVAGTRADARDLNRAAQQARLDAGEVSGFGVELQGERFHVGDRVAFTQNHRALGILNGDRGTVLGVSEGGERMTVRLDSGERRSFETATMSDLRLGYAITTHKGQGATATKAYVLAGGSMQDREMSYVQASRAREGTTLFASRAETGDGIAALARQMERSRRKETAHSVERAQEPTPEFGL